MKNIYPITIQKHKDGEWEGFSARYEGIPVEVYHEDEVQVLKDLIGAKEEHYATLKKEEDNKMLIKRKEELMQLFNKKVE